MDAAIADVLVVLCVEHTRGDDFGKSVTVDVGDDGIFHPCARRHHSGVDVVRTDGVVTRDVALAAAVHDT